MRRTEIIALVLVVVLTLGIMWLGSLLGRAPLIDSLKEANAAAIEAQDIAQTAIDSAAMSGDEITGLRADIDAMSIEASVSETTIQSLTDALTDLGYEVTIEASGTANVEKETTTATPTVSRSSDGWSTATVSWYGPGFIGNTCANGDTLTADAMNFAHKTMAFGTRVEFRYKDKTVTATCTDRGPFVAGRTFDLGPGTAKALGFSGVGSVEWRLAS